MLVPVRMLLALVAAASCFGIDLALPTPGGKNVDPFHHRQTKAVVFVFTRTDCPISNRYAPEVERLYEKFKKDVDFWLVFVDRNEPEGAILKHVREYGYQFGAILDRKHELVKLAQATVTPEAAVFAGKQLIYRGRIDDRYAAFGKARRAPAHHDLEEVLDAIAAGRPVKPATTRAIGCFIEDLE
jgi:hypothetical protein